MYTWSPSQPSTPRRVLSWFLLTFGSVFTGYAAAIFGLGAMLSGSLGFGLIAFVALIITLVQFGLSLTYLFWRGSPGAMSFGALYLIALAAIGVVAFA